MDDVAGRRTVPMAVNGTLMRGLSLNGNLVDVGAVFLREDLTAPEYRLYSVHDEHPGMVRVTDGSGGAIAVEVWAVPVTGIVDLLEQEPDGLTVGRVRLADGSTVLGVLAEPALVEGQQEITSYAGWRPYVLSLGIDP